jgi:hypothetical protein
MAEQDQRYAGSRSEHDSGGSGRQPKELAEQYRALALEKLPPSMGFSARLNMLWDLAGVVPSQFEGRVLAVMGINSNWRESEVRKWLQKDELPTREELRNMVTFLVSQLDEGQDVSRWEAFLVYGTPVVSSPINHSLYREDQARREIASLIFAQLTDEYGISPSSYDADKAFQRCLSLMHKFNIYELQDFQPGHLEPFRNYMFPSE